VGDVTVLLVDGRSEDDPDTVETAGHVLTVRVGGSGGGDIVGDQRLADLLGSIRSLLAAPPRVLSLDRGAARGRRRALTSHELDVLRLIGTGSSAPEIAATLHTTVGGVESTKRRIFTKLGVQTQTHAVAHALRDGLLSAPRTARPGRTPE
jgi:DNA-binding CsgD family transcriptional regulator